MRMKRQVRVAHARANTITRINKLVLVELGVYECFVYLLLV